MNAAIYKLTDISFTNFSNWINNLGYKGEYNTPKINSEKIFEQSLPLLNKYFNNNFSELKNEALLFELKYITHNELAMITRKKLNEKGFEGDCFEALRNINKNTKQLEIINLFSEIYKDVLNYCIIKANNSIEIVTKLDNKEDSLKAVNIKKTPILK